jgi:hypothetical protein
MSGSIRVIRKYLKNRVLPPLRQTDIIDRPEVGTTLRNKLCALLTSPSGYVTELVSTFLFILVKENGNCETELTLSLTKYLLQSDE